MNATKTQIKVAITRCSRCNREHTLFAPFSGDCPRCGAPNSRHHTRWISNPHPDSIDQARRESR